MFTDVRVLAVDTVRVCWRLSPQILTIYLLGWLGNNLALKIAVIGGDVSGWVALAIFAFSFLSTLVAVVLILRLCGRELGIWNMMPPEESIVDDRDSSLTRMLAVTLLPFLSLYAAFGQVNEAAGRLLTEQLFRNSGFGPDSVLDVVRSVATDHPWRLLLILLVVYSISPRQLADAPLVRRRSIYRWGDAGQVGLGPDTGEFRSRERALRARAAYRSSTMASERLRGPVPARSDAFGVVRRPVRHLVSRSAGLNLGGWIQVGPSGLDRCVMDAPPASPPMSLPGVRPGGARVMRSPSR